MSKTSRVEILSCTSNDATIPPAVTLLKPDEVGNADCHENKAAYRYFLNRNFKNDSVVLYEIISNYSVFISLKNLKYFTKFRYNKTNAVHK